MNRTIATPATIRLLFCALFLTVLQACGGSSGSSVEESESFEISAQDQSHALMFPVNPDGFPLKQGVINPDEYFHEWHAVNAPCRLDMREHPYKGFYVKDKSIVLTDDGHEVHLEYFSDSACTKKEGDFVFWPSWEGDLIDMPGHENAARGYEEFYWFFKDVDLNIHPNLKGVFYTLLSRKFLIDVHDGKLYFNDEGPYDPEGYPTSLDPNRYYIIAPTK